MADIYHPPVEFDVSAIHDPQTYIAKEVFRLVYLFGQQVESTIDERMAIVPVTDTAIIGNEESPEDKVAFRVRGIPVLITAGVELLPDAEIQTEDILPSDDYFVASIEHATVPEDARLIRDDQEYDYAWRPYVSVIIDTNNNSDISIVDSNNGHELEADDLIAVSAVMSGLSKEFLNLQFESELKRTAQMNTNSIVEVDLDDEDEDDLDPTIDRTFRLYDPKERIMSSCEPCADAGSLCVHGVELQN